VTDDGADTATGHRAATTDDAAPMNKKIAQPFKAGFRAAKIKSPVRDERKVVVHKDLPSLAGLGWFV